jgi:hypothetical protein
MLIFRDKSFVVCQIFAAGANPAQKLVTSQTSHEIRPVQLQVKSEFLEDASSQNKCHAEGHITTRNKTTVCVCMCMNIHSMHILAWKANVAIENIGQL